MDSADLYAWLIEATLATSAAVLALLALRKPLRAAFGAGACYAAWTAVPVALLATLLPAAVADAPVAPLAIIGVPMRMLAAEVPHSAGPDTATLACIAWIVGCLLFAGHLALQQYRFVRGLGGIKSNGDGLLLADAVAGLPAVIGLWKPRIVLPADALSRYDAAERGLMLAHEREHIARGDLIANAFVAALRCLFWFNPLLHIAARRFRDDQELACDQRVIARHPQERRAYGEAMLKTQMAAGTLPLGCHWGQSHPLKERIEMLKRPLPSNMRRAGGRALVIAILSVSGYAAWAAQPATLPVDNPATSKISVTMSGDQMNMRAVIANLASEHHMSVSGLHLIPAEQKMSFGLDGIPLETVLELLSEGMNLDFRQQGNQIVISKEKNESAAELLRRPPLAYPVDVLKKGVSSMVVLVVDVAEDGSVSGAQVDHSAGNESLDAAALEAVKQWKFKPMMKDGKPAASQVRVPIKFAPEGDPDAKPAQSSVGSTKTADANRWGSYEKMVASLSASWKKPAEPEDDC